VECLAARQKARNRRNLEVPRARGPLYITVRTLRSFFDTKEFLLGSASVFYFREFCCMCQIKNVFPLLSGKLQVEVRHLFYINLHLTGHLSFRSEEQFYSLAFVVLQKRSSLQHGL
jgi:hypothetical protein